MLPAIAFAAAAGAWTVVAALRRRGGRAAPGGDSGSAADVDGPTAAAVVREFDGAFGAAVRREFALDWRFTHLNHGSYGTAPHRVLAAVREAALSVEAFPDDFFRRRATAAYCRMADAVGAFVGAPPRSTVLLDNATTAVNAVLRALEPLEPRDILVINDNTYNACKLAVREVARVFGAQVATINFPFPITSTAEITAAFHAQLQETLRAAAAKAAPGAPAPRLRWVLLDHITSPTALVMPVTEMAAIAHSMGADVMVDGAHAPGQLPLDLATLGADWYTGNLHKWCFAMKGVAFLYTAPSKQAAQQAPIISHNAYRPYQERFFMQGTNDQSRFAAIPAALAFMGETLGGVDRMRRYNEALATAGASLLCELWGTSLMAPRHLMAPFLAVVETPFDTRYFLSNVPPQVSRMSLTNAASDELAARDWQLNEAVAEAVFRRAGIQSQFFYWRMAGVGRIFCRISAQVYNTLDDYRLLGEAVLGVLGDKEAELGLKG